MSLTARGGGFRGRGRGSPAPTSPRGRGVSSTRARGGANNAGMGGNAGAVRGFGATPARASTGRAPRGPSNSTRGTGAARGSGSQSGVAKTRGSWQDRYTALNTARTQERADAIQQGLIADPEQPRALSDAITPVGICQDMCAEHERVQRVVQKDVWPEETNPNHSAFAITENEPDEARMVKKFRRAAAGIDEQLPSDLRPPHVLKKTCDYLFDDVIGNATALAKVHLFVWDRTRAIRNDFSIQQLTKPEELQIAVECYERIARFHMLSLHQLALPEKPYSKYDWQQEREQLDRTLLSLMQYYDDSRGRVELPNEAEFRAYCVIFQLQDPTPDLEDRVQTWQGEVARNPRVRMALELYAAACNSVDTQGPLKPRASHLAARQDWQSYWVLIASNKISYLMACVAEIYFNLVRRTVLNALFRTFRGNTTMPTPDWTVDLLCELLAFDDTEEVIQYCEKFGFGFKALENGEVHLDLTSVKGKTLPSPSAGLPRQTKTSLVEDKRLGRTLPAVINGLTVKEARNLGQVNEEEFAQVVEDAQGSGLVDESETNGVSGDGVGGGDDGESLFIPESTAGVTPSSSAQPFGSNLGGGLGTTGSGSWSFGTAPTAAQPSAFAAPTPAPPSTFGAPSGTFGAPSGTFGKPSQSIAAPKAPSPFAAQSSPFGQAPSASKTGSTSTRTGPNLDFLKPSPQPVTEQANSASLPDFQFPKSSSFSGEQGNRPAEASSKAAEPSLAAPVNPFGQSSPPTQSDSKPFSHFGIPSSTPDAKREESPFSFTSPQTPAGPSITFGQSTPNPEAATSGSSTPSFTGFLPTESKAAPQAPGQPHYTAPPSPPKQSSNLAPSNQTSANQASNGATLKRPSVSQDTRPKKPSPLSHSFSASDDTTGATASKPADAIFAPELVKPLPSDIQRPTYQPSEASTKPGFLPSKPVESLDATISRVAKEIVSDELGGYLKQYVEFAVGITISEVQSELAEERDNAEADEFRQFSLHLKYGKRWKDIFWHRRLAKTGRERRQRRQRRLQARENGDTEDKSLLGSIGSSRAPSVMPGEEGSTRGEEAAGGHRDEQLAKLQPTRVGASRPASINGSGIASTPRRGGHNRGKSTSHVDPRGRVSKTARTHDIHFDMLKRSSFLGFSASPGATRKDTTRSSYFQLKALGLTRAQEPSSVRGTKRRGSESLQTVSQTSPPALRHPLSRSNSERSVSRALMPPPPVALSSTMQSAKDEDEALFARLRAAREGLKTNAPLPPPEPSDEQLKRSTGSQSSNDSASLIRARADARLRASRTQSVQAPPTTEKKLPAYRFRESRFVSKEKYGDAVDKANEIRRSRSREPSRLQSRDDEGMPGQAMSCTPARVTDDAPPPIQIANCPGNQNFSPPLPAFSQPSPGFGVSRLADHTTDTSAQNPFLQQQAPTSFSAFGSQPALGTQPDTHGFSTESQADLSQQPFAPRPASGFQNGLGSLAMFGLHTTQPSLPEAQDHTIQPTQVDQPLVSSFRSAGETGATHPPPSAFAYPPQPPQENSYLPSQTISLISDDDDESPSSSGLIMNGAGGEDKSNDELFDESTDENHATQVQANGNLSGSAGHSNRFAALADEDGEEEEEGERAAGNFNFDEFLSQNAPGHSFAQHGQSFAVTNGYGGGSTDDEDRTEEDDEGIDGDIDGDDESIDEDDGYENDGDQGGYDYSEEDEEEDGHGYDGVQPGMYSQYAPGVVQKPPPPAPVRNQALQNVGNTEEEAIELSD